MGLLLLVLLLTNLVSVAAIVVARRRARMDARWDSDDSWDSIEVFAAPLPPGVSARNRRLITIEILNPIAVATTRGGRVAALVGTIAPGLTRRIVYELTLKILQRQLTEQSVHADVRVHTLRAVRLDTGPTETATAPVIIDEVTILDMGRVSRD